MLLQLRRAVRGTCRLLCTAGAGRFAGKRAVVAGVADGIHIVLRARPTAVRYRGTGARLRRCCCTRVSRTSCSLRECQCATDCDVPAGGSPAHRVFGKMLDRRKIALDNPHGASEDRSAAVTRTQPATLSQSHSTSRTHRANNAQPVALSQHRTEPATLSQSHSASTAQSQQRSASHTQPAPHRASNAQPVTLSQSH
jgi:hypothetical protein